MLFCLSLCYLRFDGSSFITAASSNHGHRRTSLGKISAGLVAIGGYSSNEVEPGVGIRVGPPGARKSGSGWKSPGEPGSGWKSVG